MTAWHIVSTPNVLVSKMSRTVNIGVASNAPNSELAVAETAERVGYGSTSAFSVAFRRHVGQPPSRYARPE